MTEKLKSGAASKNVVDAVNDLIDRIEALEADQAAEDADDATKKTSARKTPAKTAAKAEDAAKGE